MFSTSKPRLPAAVFGVEVDVDDDDDALDTDDDRPFDSSSFAVADIRFAAAAAVLPAYVLLQSSFKANSGFAPDSAAGKPASGVASSFSRFDESVSAKPKLVKFNFPIIALDNFHIH
jgi:hypothetical protein